MVNRFFLLYFFLAQNILANDWFISRRYIDPFSQSSFSFDNKMSFGREIFKQKMFTSHKLEDTIDRSELRLSYDGKYLSSLEKNEKSQFILLITELANEKSSKKIELDFVGIYKYGWVYDSEYLWFLVDNEGDERYQLYSVNRVTAKVTNLIEKAGVKIDVLKSSHLFPAELLIKMNDPERTYFDVYKINIKTGQLKLLFKNTDNFVNFVADSNYNLCFAEKISKDCNREIYRKTGKKWELFDEIPFEDYLTTELLHISADGTKLYLKDSREQKTTALVEVNLKDNYRKVLAVDDESKADLRKIIINPKTLEIEAACFTFAKDKWQHFDSFDANTKEFFGKLIEKNNCEIDVVSRDVNDRFWIISVMMDTLLAFLLYEKQSQTFFVIKSVPFSGKTLAKTITSRDGYELVSYLTLPCFDEIRKPGTLLPMILLVHGGPWARDYFDVTLQHQLFASKGYAVLSVNFRSSIGFGKSFINAGIGQWAKNMQNDLLDAVTWAIEQKIADPKRIGIYGGSYGGYAALATLTFYPKVFACGVSFCGVSNLITLLEKLSCDSITEKPWLCKMLGGDESEINGQIFLMAQSPIFFAKNIINPLLLGHGAKDPRVRESESANIFNELRQNELPVKYAFFPDEGHSLARQGNIDVFQELTLQFFAKHLKGEEYKIESKFFESTSMVLRSFPD